jgi:hypothetical protein
MQEEIEGVLPWTQVFTSAQHVPCGEQICRSSFKWLNNGI